MSTHNIWFYGEKYKIILKLSPYRFYLAEWLLLLTSIEKVVGLSSGGSYILLKCSETVKENIWW